VLDRGEDELELPARIRVQGALRRVPAEVDHLGAVGPRLLVRRRGREEEVRVEARRDLGGRDPAAELDQRGRVGEREARLLSDLAHRRGAMRAVALTLVGVHRAAREHPRAGHEARGGIAAQQQHFQRRRAAAQDDHARRLPRLGGSARVELLAGRWTVALHRRPRY
jgi:hypothetical protein